MDPPKLTEYERRRLDNIRRNDEMMKALNISSKVSELSQSSKRQRVSITKPDKVSPEKKSKPKNPVVIRRSLRTRGIAPDSKGLDFDFVDPSEKNLRERVYVISPEKPSLDFTGPINMRNAYIGDGTDQALIATLLSFEKEPQQVVLKHVDFGKYGAVKVEKSDGVLQDNVKIEMKVESENLNGGNNTESVEKSGDGDMKDYTSTAVVCGLESGVQKCEFSDVKTETEKREMQSCVDLSSMSLKEENIARVVPGRIMLAKFLPSNNVTMIAVGNKYGNVGFWNVDGEKEEQENGIYLYRPHRGPLSGILFQQSSLSKMYTSCYDGYLRLMDVEKEVFDLLYTSDNEAIFALSQRPSDDNNLYFGEGYGSLSVYDDRMGKFAHEWSLHAGRINTIDFSSQNTNIMATSSTDGTACIWDLRRINAKKPESLRVVNHQRAVHSAYFSPSAKFLATTSFDDKIGITTGANFEDTSMIFHNNQTSRWISSFKAIWGWDDSYVFVGNMKRGVDVISPFQGRSIFTLESPLMSAIPCRFDAHPYKIGMFAGGTGGGQIYIWTSSCIYL